MLLRIHSKNILFKTQQDIKGMTFAIDGKNYMVESSKKEEQQDELFGFGAVKVFTVTLKLK